VAAISACHHSVALLQRDQKRNMITPTAGKIPKRHLYQQLLDEKDKTRSPDASSFSTAVKAAGILIKVLIF
jgi:hypothetical protein